MPDQTASWDLLADLQMLLQFHFMQNAFVAGTLVALSFIDPPIRRDLALVYRKDKTLSRAARAFMEIAVNKKALRKLAHC